MKQMLIKRAATGTEQLSGNFNACELTDAERTAGININDLIKDDRCD